MSDRFARTFIRNFLGSEAPLKCQVLHQYTGEATEDSGWKDATPNVDTQMPLIAHYRTGLFTTGVDNWIINGIERRKVSGQLQLPEGLEKIEIGGEFFIDLKWSSGTGVFSDWKTHTLRNSDHDKGVVFIVRQTTLEIHSPGGRTCESEAQHYMSHDSARRVCLLACSGNLICHT